MSERGQVVHQPVAALRPAVVQRAAGRGRRAAHRLFLLPYLAVGGAESPPRSTPREPGPGGTGCLVVDERSPPREHLGQTMDSAAADLPMSTRSATGCRGRPSRRAAPPPARWRVETLVTWNGCTLFYDLLAELRAERPALRIANQLFNHAGGWIEHCVPRVVAGVDLFVAVNSRIARPLRRGGAPGA